MSVSQAKFDGKTVWLLTLGGKAYQGSVTAHATEEDAKRVRDEARFEQYKQQVADWDVEPAEDPEDAESVYDWLCEHDDYWDNIDNTAILGLPKESWAKPGDLVWVTLGVTNHEDYEIRAFSNLEAADECRKEMEASDDYYQTDMSHPTVDEHAKK